MAKRTVKDLDVAGKRSLYVAILTYLEKTE